MIKLLRRKTRLIVETPLDIQGRPLVAHVVPSGLVLRLKGQRHSLEISWAQVWNRAALIRADSLRADRTERARARKNRA